MPLATEGTGAALLCSTFSLRVDAVFKVVITVF
jgi:hypothetical protein